MLPHVHRVQLRPKKTGGTAREGNFLLHDPAYSEITQRLKSTEPRQNQTEANQPEWPVKDNCFLARMKERSSRHSDKSVKREEKELMEECSPRVRNLQVEMDALRSEIQRLKSIDIHTLSSSSTRINTPQGECHSQNSQLKRERPCSKEEARVKLMQLGLVSHASDSEMSEQTSSDVEDFEGFIQQLRREQEPGNTSNVVSDGHVAETCHVKSSVSVHSSKSRSSKRSANSASWEHVNCTVSTGTDPDPLTCMQCMALQTERFHLVGELHQLQDELKDQRKRHAEAQKDYAEVRQQMAKQLRTVDVGVMTVDRPDESEKLEIEEGTQCNLFAPEREELEKEIQRLQRECTEKERLCVALQEENENFKQHRTDTLADEDLGDVVKDDLDKSLVALLMDAGIYNEAIVSTVGNIRYLFQTQPAETCGDDRSTEVEEKLQETQQHLLQEKDAEISNLVEEKNVLAQKVLELRKAAKKEASDKEAAKLETSKLQNDMKEQHSEMEQCRQLVQQKRQQISELEDTLAVMQHENENWERDYEILTRRKDHLERELRIAKNLENTQTTDA